MPVEPMDASTMPRSVLPSTPSGFAPPALEDEEPAGDLDLNLDAPAPEVAHPVTMPEATHPMTAAPASAAGPDSSLDFELPEVEMPPAPAPAAQAPVEFDLGSLSLDLDTPRAAAPAAPQPVPELADLELPGAAEGVEEADPLMRKLELAEEFRQIGDMEGARDLIEEVIAKANGSLKARAQGMLETLA
jgi:pilus assembly protein FimV